MIDPFSPFVRTDKPGLKHTTSPPDSYSFKQTVPVNTF